MFSSLLRPKRVKKQQQPISSRQSYFEPSRRHSQNPHARHGDDDHSSASGDDDDEELAFGEDELEEDEDEEVSEEDGDDMHEATPLLPIFSAAHLDSLPVYNLTHSVRLLIIQRCETTLSWEQLRSPQISQFLVKPIQQQIRSSHFSRATLYALLANCLQFNKEGQLNPGNVGVCRTRGLVAELLAMRLLREYTVRELIDALSYDFDPLQGVTPPPSSQDNNNNARRRFDTGTRGQSVRTSTLEVAIRAQAKRFLAHPLCVQHLEAIWAGSIVFHSAADSLHRYPSKPALNINRHYGATHTAGEVQSSNQLQTPRPPHVTVRRSVTLYNPKEASIFKLSRLRVPKYRNLFSTLSYAVILGLFLAVLIERSLEITALEIVFWFWSAGFMLDEIVGFSEQGFNLYIMSVWNIFDLGILLLWFVYYTLRFYGLLIAERQRNHIANIAYDVLASTAVLLFPRLFSLLDHYRYFSQLLIAFRMMAQDLAAILVLIGISCSGFFVAFTLSFGDDNNNGSAVAYALFQILMGFTPAAWDVWPTYNPLGKALLALFLIICHFLVVTILITVLTNSFMAIVKNAEEEHQFLFAVNVLSMVKSDALFSYIAPSNILGWMISPLRFIMPFRHYVKLNRTVIKLTHFPVLFMIFAYERIRLARYIYEPAELVEVRGRQKGRLPAYVLAPDRTHFTSTARVRESSITTRYKDRALEEVFKRPFRGASNARKSSVNQVRQANVVDNWIDTMGDITSPPPEDSRTVLDRLEVTRRPLLPRSTTSIALSTRRLSASRSNLSDPANRTVRRRPQPILESDDVGSRTHEPPGQQTEADGDDELPSVDDEDEMPGRNTSPSRSASDPREQTTLPPSQSTPKTIAASPQMNRQLGRAHNRHSSVNTIVYKPATPRTGSSSSTDKRPFNPAQSSIRFPSSLTTGYRTAAVNTPTLKRPQRPATALRVRPALPNRDDLQSAPNLTRFLENAERNKRMRSFHALALDLASDIGDNRPLINEHSGNMAGSYNAAMDLGNAMRRRDSKRERQKVEESSMMSRMVLARMNTLEEGFKDILKEVKDWRNSSRGTSDVGDPLSTTASQRRLARRIEKSRRQIEDISPDVKEGSTSHPPIGDVGPSDWRHDD